MTRDLAARVRALASDWQERADTSRDCAVAREGLSDADALTDYSATMSRRAADLLALLDSPDAEPAERCAVCGKTSDEPGWTITSTGPVQLICPRCDTDTEPAEDGDEVEALAEWLTAECMVDHRWRCNYPDIYGDCDCADRDARELLASDWLARRDAETAARALRDTARSIEGMATASQYGPHRRAGMHDAAARCVRLAEYAEADR